LPLIRNIFFFGSPPSGDWRAVFFLFFTKSRPFFWLEPISKSSFFLFLTSGLRTPFLDPGPPLGLPSRRYHPSAMPSTYLPVPRFILRFPVPFYPAIDLPTFPSIRRFGPKDPDDIPPHEASLCTCPGYSFLETRWPLFQLRLRIFHCGGNTAIPGPRAGIFFFCPPLPP